MKKIVMLFFILLVSFAFMFNLKADCKSDKEAASNMFIDGGALLMDDDRVNVNIDLSGLTEDMYVSYFNTFTNETIKYTSENFEQGAFLYIETKDITKNSEFKVTVYSNSCGEEKLRTYEYSYTGINKYALSEYCKNNNHFKSDLCSIDADTSNMTEEEVKKKIEHDIKMYDLKLNTINGIKEYYLYVLVPFLVIVSIYGIRIYILKKKQEDKLSQ